MNKEKINRVEEDCKELLRRIKVLKEDQDYFYVDRWFGSAKTSAVRRQSMELTRSLADLRKAGR